MSMDIQILRGDENYNPKESNHILKDGQPFYSKKTNSLYMGDGTSPLKDINGTPLNLNGEGENSIQLPLEGEDFTYIGSDKITHTYSNKTIGNYSANLSPQGKVEREYSLNVGYQNTLEFRDGETAGYTDGGAIIGYRNYSNSSSSFLTGAWNKALNSKQVLISGYNNAINDTQSSKTGCSAIFGGMNYLNGTIRNSMLVGYGLLNKGGWEYHFGKWNKPIEGVRFSIGNGEESYYFWKHKFVVDYKTVTKEMLSTYINTNETRHHPRHEECYYLYNNNDQTTISAGVLLLNIGDIREVDGVRYWVFDTNKYDNGEDTQKLELNSTTKLGVLKNGARSNAFQVTDNGTAQLIRKNNPDVTNDNEILVRSEIKDLITNTIDNDLNIKNGEGENSLQLPQSAESFTYKSSGTDYTYETATTGKDALNLSSLGRITRNGYAVVGNCNTVEFDANNKLDEDDGGIIAGYKNYTNTRGSSVFGAHNRLLDTKNSFIMGYQNVLYGDAGDGSSSSLVVGGKNYMQSNTRHSAMIGYGLKNNTAYPFQYYFGTWNNPGTQQDKLRFIIGNGTENWIYQDVQLGTPDTRPKPTLQECINNNEKLKYNPNKEGWRYIKIGSSYQLITNITSQTDFDNSLVYQYKNVGRSNAFQVSSDGRAQLIRKNNPTLADDDLLTKKEIEDIVVNHTYNGGTKLYKHKINFTINVDDGNSYNFQATYLSTQPTPVQGINNNTWFNLPKNGTLVQNESEFNFYMNSNVMMFEIIKEETFSRVKVEIWKDYQNGWQVGDFGNSTSLKFNSDEVIPI